MTKKLNTRENEEKFESTSDKKNARSLRKVEFEALLNSGLRIGELVRHFRHADISATQYYVPPSVSKTKSRKRFAEILQLKRQVPLK